MTGPVRAGVGRPPSTSVMITSRTPLSLIRFAQADTRSRASTTRSASQDLDALMEELQPRDPGSPITLAWTTRRRPFSSRPQRPQEAQEEGEQSPHLMSSMPSMILSMTSGLSLFRSKSSVKSGSAAKGDAAELLGILSQSEWPTPAPTTTRRWSFGGHCFDQLLSASCFGGKLPRCYPWSDPRRGSRRRRNCICSCGTRSARKKTWRSLSAEQETARRRWPRDLRRLARTPRQRRCPTCHPCSSI